MSDQLLGKQFANETITAAILASNAVEETKINANAVTAAKLATNAVEEAKINAGAVTETKIGANAVTSAKIAASAVGATQLDTDAVTTPKIQDAAVTGDKLNASAKQSVLESKIDCFALKVGNLAAGSSTTTDALTDTLFQALKTAIGVDGLRTGANAALKGFVTDSGQGQNRAILTNDATDGDIVDGSNNRVFARVTREDTGQAGLWTFTNGSPTVTVATSTTGGLSVGQYLAHTSDSTNAVGKIQSIDDANTVTLEDNWDGDTVSGAVGCQVSVLRISFFIKSGGTETAHTMGGETITLYVPVAMDLFELPFGVLGHTVLQSEGFPAGHIHDDRYFTESELQATDSSGANLAGSDRVGLDTTSLSNISGTTVQAGMESINTTLGTLAAGSLTPQKDNITPAGTLAPGNSFATTLTATPIANSGSLLINGVEYTEGVGNSYTITGTTVNWLVTAPFTIDSATDTVIFKYDS